MDDIRQSYRRTAFGLRHWSHWNRWTFRISVGILFIFIVGSVSLALIGYEWTNGARRGWAIGLAAVVGYMTNYVAVEMLFRPYQPGQLHWLRMLTCGLWRHGVVPSRKSEIAHAVGEQFADHLLTPERIGREIVVVVERLLDDPDLRRRVRLVLGPVLRKQLPVIVDRLTPEVVSLVRTAAKTALTREQITEFIEAVLQPWLAHAETRETVVNLLVNFLKDNVPRITEEIRRVANLYAQSKYARSLAFAFAEWLGLLDWQDVRYSLQSYFHSYEARQKLYASLADIGTHLATTLVTHPELAQVLQELAEQARDVFGDRVETFLQEYLPEMGNRLADAPALWNWLAHDAVPSAKPYIVAWLERDGGSVYLARQFDVAKRVQEAIDELRIEEIHGLVQRVSGNELGAIQVLGFILGGLAGGAMSLFLF